MIYNRSEIEGQRMPWYLGRAYFLLATDRVCLLPIPINWLVAWSRSFYFFLLRGPRSVALDRRERELVRREKSLYCPGCFPENVIEGMGAVPIKCVCCDGYVPVPKHVGAK